MWGGDCLIDLWMVRNGQRYWLRGVEIDGTVGGLVKVLRDKRDQVRA